MERTEKTWLLEIILAAVVAAMLAALLGLAGWTANKVVENGEKIAELNGKFAALNGKFSALEAKMDLLITGLNISVAPKDKASASAAPSGAQRSGFRAGAERGFQVGAGEAATE